MGFEKNTKIIDLINIHSFRRNKSQEDNKQSDTNNDALMTQSVKEEKRDKDKTIKDNSDKSKIPSFDCDFNFDDIVSI